MKKNFFFLKGILALALVFTLFLAGCKEDDSSDEKEPAAAAQQPSNKEVNLPGIDDPDVTEVIVYDGVILTWSPIKEADSYEVWRNGGGQKEAKRLTATKTVTINSDGKCEFFDQVSVTNVLKPGTQYTYTVIAVPLTGVKDIGTWEKVITFYEPLFDTGTVLTIDTVNITTNAITITDNAGIDTVTGFYVRINLSALKLQTGVTYTFERAVLDADNKPEDYQRVTLSSFPTIDRPIGNPTVDIFGNLSFAITTVYDRGLPPNEGKYQYRIKGEKDSVTDYIKSNIITIDFTEYLIQRISLNVGAKTTEGGEISYEITPGFTFGSRKNMLQSTDKVVLYWLIGSADDCYKTGPYKSENIISFSKSDIESALITTTTNTKNLIVQQSTGDNYLYVQAWLERANGDKIKIEDATKWTGEGILSRFSNNGQYHVRLDY